MGTIRPSRIPRIPDQFTSRYLEFFRFRKELNGVGLFFVLFFFEISFNFWSKLFKMCINGSCSVIVLYVNCFTITTSANFYSIDPSVLDAIDLQSLSAFCSNIQSSMEMIASKLSKSTRKLNGYFQGRNPLSLQLTKVKQWKKNKK